jgi:hypothetical protein
MVINPVPVAVVYVHKKIRRKQSVSVDLSLSRYRSFVLKIPAVEKTRSASTDVGGTVNRCEYTVCMHVPCLPVLHGEQRHLCCDNIHKLLGKLGVGTGTGRLGFGTRTGDGGKAGLGVRDI